jgi:sigma-B regulation protein RsbU (phosphoserine phosphatase)
LSKIEKLERELHLKQLQINRLLNITQAINDNVSATDLYRMYTSFLSWEMGVRKMALFVPDEGKWRCRSSIGIDEKLLQEDISKHLPTFQRLKNLNEKEHPLFREFDIVIPVLHKKFPIAYTFLGGFDENDDMYNKVQFITTITNIIAVAIENKRLFKRQLEQERLKREMQLAKDMQQMLVPSKLPSSSCFEMASIYKPHMSVGGDYFDYVELSDKKFVFCVADISGKGLAAALLMSNFQANFRTLIQKEEPFDCFIRELNESVYRITNGEKFLTFFVAKYDREDQLLTYINAGHNPPIMMHKDELVLLDKGCTLLGPFQELPEVEVGYNYIDGSALVLAYTDGLIDIRNEDGDFFNENLVFHFAREYAEMEVHEFNNKLLKEIDMFRGEESYPDDFTILTCRIFNPK